MEARYTAPWPLAALPAVRGGAMRKLRTMAILVLTCGPAALAQRGVPAPAAGSIISTTDLTFDGGGFAHETFTLSGPAQGDWYVTATDAHTTLTLTSPAGPRSVRVEVE